jgi:hypothetical protein
VKLSLTCSRQALDKKSTVSPTAVILFAYTGEKLVRMNETNIEAECRPSNKKPPNKLGHKLSHSRCRSGNPYMLFIITECSKLAIPILLTRDIRKVLYTIRFIDITTIRLK